VNRCVWCHEPMDDTKRRRNDAVTCSNRCRKALSRDAKRHRSSSSTDGGSVTAPGVPYPGPSRPSETGPFATDRATRRFRAQLSRNAVASQPLSLSPRRSETCLHSSAGTSVCCSHS
jgi:hypothetical protein